MNFPEEDFDKYFFQGQIQKGNVSIRIHDGRRKTCEIKISININDKCEIEIRELYHTAYITVFVLHKMPEDFFVAYISTLIYLLLLFGVKIITAYTASVAIKV